MKHLHTYRKPAIVVLLVALLAGLLPPQPSLARSARAATYQAENQPVDVPPEAVRANFWVANAMSRVSGPERAEMVAFELVLMHLYKQNPDLAPAVAVQRIHDLQAAYHNSSQANLSKYTKTANENALAIFAVLSGLAASPSTGAVVAAANETYVLTLRDSLAGATYGADRILGAAETFYPALAQDLAQQTLLQETLDFAQHNQRFGQAFDTLWAAELHVGTNASTTAIIQSSPAIQSLTSVTHLLDSSGAIHTDLTTLKNLTLEQYWQINTLSLNAQTLLLELDAHQTELADYIHNTQAQEADKKKAADGDKATKDGLDKAEQAIGLLAPLIKRVNPSLGKSLEIAGKASIAFVKAVSAYSTAVAGLGIAKALLTFDTVELVGKLAGVLLSLSPLFAEEEGPNADAQILEQVGKLREQVARLGEQMHSRFDRIDKALNSIYATLNFQFTRIWHILQGISEDTHDIKVALTELQQKLNRLESHLHDLLSAGFQHPLLEEINGKIGYRQIHSGQEMSPSDYNHAENLFQTWATLHAFDSLATGPSARSYTDMALYDELNNYPIDVNINYLSQFIDQRWHLPPLSTSLVANPRIWSISARSYAELELDWPNYARTIDPDRANKIIQKGQNVQAALRQISTLNTNGQPQANYALFDKLIANYKEKAASFDQAVPAVENAYLEERRIDGRLRVGTIDPWGGVNQPIDPANLLPGPTVTLCGSTDGAKPAPDNFSKAMLPAPFHVAQYLNGDQETSPVTPAVSACYDAHWTDIYDIVTGPIDYPLEVTYGRLQVELTAKYTISTTTQLIRTRFVKLPEVPIGHGRGPSEFPDPRATATAQWETGDSIKAAFESYSDVSLDNPAPADVVNRVGNALKRHQIAIYQRVLDNLAVAGPLKDAATALSGAKSLLEAFIALGLPRALETNEYLRSFVYGQQGLLEENSAHLLTAQWQALRATPPDHNGRADIKALTNRRADALKEVLWHYLDLINQHTYSESHRMIDTTLDRLRIANALVRTPILSLSAGSLSFDRQLIGTVSATRTITLTNSGLAAPISISGISLLGANAGDFAGANACGSSLAAGARCTITLSFTPSTVGNRAAELRIADSAPGAPHSVSLAGTGWFDAVFNAPAPVAEGSPINLSLRKQSDPSNPNPWGPDFSYAFDCGAGYSSFAPGTSVACPTNDNGLRTVKARVQYKGADLVELTAPMTITTVAPTADFLAPAAAAEGGTINLALQNTTDPSSADTAAGFSYAFDCGAGYGAFGPSAGISCPAADSGVLAVRGKVKDKDGGVTEYSASVAVANVAPTASFSAPASATEGGTINLALQNATDPSSTDTAAGFSYAFDCGGGYGGFGASASVNCTTTDSGVLTVKGKVKDKDAGTSEYTATVAVANVAPTAGFVAPATVAEGSPINLALQNATDPSSADTAAGFSYAFDCGTGYSAFGPSKTATCPTTDNGVRAVKGKVKDKDGGVAEYSASVAITNIAPGASFQAPQQTTTGHKFDLLLADAVDAPGDLSSLQYAFDCGDGAGYGAFGPSKTATCVINTAGTSMVRGKVKDKDGAITEYSASVTSIDAIALSILSPSSGAVVPINTSVKLSARFTDRILDATHSCVINWGDGTAIEEGTVTESFMAKSCDADHIYTTAGQYTIKVVVTNTYGDTSAATVTIVVEKSGK